MSKRVGTWPTLLPSLSFTIIAVKLFIGLLYLRGCTIQEVGGEMMMGSSMYGVAVIDGSLYSRVESTVLTCSN